MIVATIDWRILTATAVLLALAMVLLYRLLNRDPNIKRVRYGFFVERDHYDEEGWPEPPGAGDTKDYEVWPDADTQIKPPEEERK